MGRHDKFYNIFEEFWWTHDQDSSPGTVLDCQGQSGLQMVLYATFTLIKNTTVLLIFAKTDNNGAIFIRTDGTDFYL